MIKYPIEHIKDRLSKLDVALLGTGPSLWNHNPAKILQSHTSTIGINSSWKFMRANYHCALDKEHIFDYISGNYTPMNGYIITSKELEHMFVFEKYICSAIFADMFPRIPFSPEQTWRTNLALGGFPEVTGLFAIQLAIYMGASRIWLLGFDSRLDRTYQHRYYDYAAKKIAKERPDVEIYNCNPDSLIKAFEKKEREDWRVSDA